MRGLIATLLVVVLILVIVDLVSSPAPNPSQCILDTDIVLPDTCAGNCDPGRGCTPSTLRPYLVIFTQAASCADICDIVID